METWGTSYGPYCASDETYATCNPWLFFQGDIVVPSTINGLKVVGISYQAFVTYKDIDRYQIIPNNLIKSVYLPEGIRVIDEAAFAMCENITNINLPSTIKQIAQKSFWGCKRLQNVSIPQGLEFIGDFAFVDCDLSTLHFENHNIRFGVGVFEGNNNLKDIYCSKTQELHHSIFNFTCGCPKTDFSSMTIHCYKDTPAYNFAIQNGCLIDIIG